MHPSTVCSDHIWPVTLSLQTSMWHCFFFCYFRIKFYLFLNGTAPVHVWETETASVWLVSYNSFVTFISRIYHLDPLFDSGHENGSYIQTMQKCRVKMLEEFSLLFSLSTCTMIGQFSGPLFPRYGQINSKISMNSNLPPLTELRDIINIAYYPRFSVLTVSYSVPLQGPRFIWWLYRHSIYQPVFHCRARRWWR